MFNAEYPAALGLYYECGIRVFDVMWKALAQSNPERLTAGHYGSICGTIIGGIHPETGQPHSFIEPEIGGWGATEGQDGGSAQYTGAHGDTFNCPVEVNEARNGVFIDQYAFNLEPGGDGQFRGGKGICLDYRIRGPESWITAMYTRGKYAPWGLRGGRDGTHNYVRILRLGRQRGEVQHLHGSEPAARRRGPRGHRDGRRVRRPAGPTRAKRSSRT